MSLETKKSLKPIEIFTRGVSIGKYPHYIIMKIPFLATILEYLEDEPITLNEIVPPEILDMFLKYYLNEYNKTWFSKKCIKQFRRETLITSLKYLQLGSYFLTDTCPGEGHTGTKYKECTRTIGLLETNCPNCFECKKCGNFFIKLFNMKNDYHICDTCLK